MAKALVAAVLLVLLAVAHAADPKYDCDGAKQLAKVGNACSMMCDCAAGLNSAYKKPEMRNQCMKLCSSCTAAAGSCKSGGPLPSACEAGAKISESKQCITSYLKSQARGRRF